MHAETHGLAKPQPAILVIPSGEALGAEIRGIDLRQMSESSFDALEQALFKHLVVVIRGQPLADAELIVLGRRFGELEPPGMSIIGKHYIDEHPEILVISNIVENGVPKGNLGAGEAIWHTDMSYRPRPTSIAILHALEIPPSGGNTYFANQYLAYDTLPVGLKQMLEGRMLVHDETYNSAGQLRKGFREVTDPREAPGARHPIFRTHPATGRRALYLGRRRNGYIIGLPLEESEALLDQLWAHASRPESVWAHEWSVGDTLIWDNRCVIHRRDAFDPGARRMMHRVQIKGENPA
ncbi:MAG TPA: TauD/TfdA family dioxygenase [Burkholderiales bacterium]|nr:TauD/TfdA family dioxygenase [Burkholderiales bacterium]